jgi:hypothetical protein
MTKQPKLSNRCEMCTDNYKFSWFTSYYFLLFSFLI